MYQVGLQRLPDTLLGHHQKVKSSPEPKPVQVGCLSDPGFQTPWKLYFYTRRKNITQARKVRNAIAFSSLKLSITHSFTEGGRSQTSNSLKISVFFTFCSIFLTKIFMLNVPSKAFDTWVYLLKGNQVHPAYSWWWQPPSPRPPTSLVWNRGTYSLTFRSSSIFFLHFFRFYIQFLILHLWSETSGPFL